MYLKLLEAENNFNALAEEIVIKHGELIKRQHAVSYAAEEASSAQESQDAYEELLELEERISAAQKLRKYAIGISISSPMELRSLLKLASIDDENTRDIIQRLFELMEVKAKYIDELKELI